MRKRMAEQVKRKATRRKNAPSDQHKQKFQKIKAYMRKKPPKKLTAKEAMEFIDSIRKPIDRPTYKQER